ncbi:MAG: PhoH family protein [Spirochaetia bacterium]|uniref:PhoH family protein n=1 Tax=Treponema sp. TaxID=166 RepID=UPI00298DA07A|nr:PhoH family protein [Treponema sp.]MCI7398258.1 PhoH family protein [Spirochaetia bacterium]MCI7576934.1 PhoH family protein [Spirochaetia bacterium]
MPAYTIIVPDSDVLSRLCGTNDCNLRLIEEFLGLSIFAQGNELSVETDDPALQQQFNFIINRILDEFSDGTIAVTDGELIQSVLNNGDTGDHQFLTRYSIQIPGGTKKVYPRTKGQALLVHKMRTTDMVFACGPAGSGKTFLAVAEALKLLLSHKVNSIVLTRPVVEAGESLGFLPGDLNEKINPYIRPLYDAMGAVLPKETVKRLTDNGIIEVAPLAYMRGRTLNDCAVILDEAQNTSIEQMKMFLTRMGENSKVFITGDPTQVDLPKKMTSGLVHALEILKDVDGISIARLDSGDVVRNELVKKIIRAYENEEK